MSCRRSSRFWGLGCPKIFHEIEDSLDSVNVSDWHFQRLRDDVQIEETQPGIWAQMAGTTIYDPVLGLALETDVPAAADLVI